MKQPNNLGGPEKSIEDDKDSPLVAEDSVAEHIEQSNQD
jgi:hypothetical protein